MILSGATLLSMGPARPACMNHAHREAATDALSGVAGCTLSSTLPHLPDQEQPGISSSHPFFQLLLLLQRQRLR